MGCVRRVPSRARLLRAYFLSLKEVLLDKKLDVKKEEKKVRKIIDNLLPIKELEKEDKNV